MKEYYNIKYRGNKRVLTHFNNYRALRVYKNGLEMSQNIGWYLLNRDCEICIKNESGEIIRTLESYQGNPQPHF
jgi:hypothetical protein